MKVINSIKEFFGTYADELLTKVTWPKADELQNNTITVLIASLLIAVLVALLDFGFSKGLTFLYSLFN